MSTIQIKFYDTNTKSWCEVTPPPPPKKLTSDSLTSLNDDPLLFQKNPNHLHQMMKNILNIDLY